MFIKYEKNCLPREGVTKNHDWRGTYSVLEHQNDFKKRGFVKWGLRALGL